MKKKVLFLGTQNIKENITNGGMQCSKRNYNLITEVIDEKHLFSAIIWNSKEKYDRNQFFERCTNNSESLLSSIKMCRLYKYTEEKRILSYIEQIDPDVLFVDTTVLGKIIKKINRNKKIIVFMHNVEKEYAKHRIINEGCKYFPAYIATVYNERLSIKYANKLICLNKRDSELVQKIYSRNADYLLPISFKDIFKQSKVSRKDFSHILLFIGSNFGPNYDGIKWFIDNVMLELQEYRLIVVGKDFEKVRDELKRENITIVGTVDNLEEYYYKYFNIVLPIKYGDGMKVKTAEAMMFGMNIFATEEALEGYDVEHVRGIFKCNSKDEFIKKIRQNSNNSEKHLWNKEVRDAYIKNHCFDGQIELMRKILFDW